MSSSTHSMDCTPHTGNLWHKLYKRLTACLLLTVFSNDTCMIYKDLQLQERYCLVFTTVHS